MSEGSLIKNIEVLGSIVPTDSKKSIFKPITPRPLFRHLDRLCRIEFCIFLSEWILVKVKEVAGKCKLLKPRLHPVLPRPQQGALT